MTTRNFLILHFVRDDLHISGMRGNAFHASQRYIKAITRTIMYVADMAQPARMFFTYPLIDPITYYELCRELIDHDSTIRWCQTLKLLPSSKTCSCGRGMNLVKRKGSPEELGWRCPRRGCRKEVTLRKGTFFEGT